MSKLAESFVIDNNEIGRGKRCYIIAEGGSNHNCDLKLAFKLIDTAAEAKVDAIKFQTFSAEQIATKADIQLAKIDFAGARSLYDLYKKLELPREWQIDLFNYAKEKEITFLSTPFDEKAVDELYQMGVHVFKIASYEINHFPLLRRVAQTSKPVLLSTGMSTIGEIEEAISVLNESGCNEIGLFHCGIGFPLHPAEVNLRAMETMFQVFQCPVGYSDHTSGVTVPVAAVSMGASILEKHFTISRDMPGPDHGFALEPDELEFMVESIRIAEESLGSHTKGPTSLETKNSRKLFRSIYANKLIKKGTVITEGMISVLRPAAGLHPRYISVIVGKKVTRDLEKYEPITWDCLIECG